MKRLIPVLAVVLGGLVLASSAIAAPREIPGGNYHGVSVSDGYAYWAARPKGCGGCRRVGRTNLATGTAESLGRLPGSRAFFSLHAGGARAVVGTLNGNERTAVFEFRPGKRPKRLLARRWNNRASRNCGAVVYPGAVSPVGERSWDLLSARGTGRSQSCAAGDYRGLTSQTITQVAGEKARLQRPVWRGHAAALANASPKSSLSRTIAIDANHLLLARSANSAVLVDRKSGERSARPFAADFDPGGYGHVMAEDGSTLGSEWARRKDYDYARPILARGGSRLRLEPYTPGNGSNAYFCGNRIVQVTEDLDSETRRIAVVLRDLTGKLLTTLLAPGEADLGDLLDADCDENTLVIQAAKYPPDDGSGEGFGVGVGGPGAFDVRTDDFAKSWAIDLR